MVVGFTTTYAISAYHHWCCELKFRSGRGAQHYVIKFVSDLRRVGGFLRFPPPIKLTHDITEILLKVAFNTIKRKKKIYIFVQYIDLPQVPFLLLTCYESSRVRDMVFNTNFKNISVISWQSVLFVEETGVPRENHTFATSHWQIYHKMLYWVHLNMSGIQAQNVSGDRYWLHK